MTELTYTVDYAMQRMQQALQFAYDENDFKRAFQSLNELKDAILAERKENLATKNALVVELAQAAEPMVPYKIDPLEFCREAHRVKDEHISKALALLTPPVPLTEDEHVE